MKERPADRYPVVDRFASKCVINSAGCWIWIGKVGHEGYGRFSFRKRWWLAHRFSYTMRYGPIPAGYHIDHLCRVRLCTNPRHLEAVTQTENNRRAQNWNPDIRPCGHARTPETTKTTGGCKVCNARYQRAYRAAATKEAG